MQDLPRLQEQKISRNDNKRFLINAKQNWTGNWQVLNLTKQSFNGTE